MDPALLLSNPRFGRQPSSSADPPPAPAPPPRRAGHRRAHSEVSLRVPDDVLFDFDPDFGIADIDLPSPSAGGPKEPPVSEDKLPSHLRSLSLDSSFFDSLGFAAAASSGSDGVMGRSDSKRAHHARSSSMDGSTPAFEAEPAPMEYGNKAMPPDKVAELALIDPRRAKRILANRQSASRSKERKVRYTGELEKKVQTLQTEATTLSAQLTVLQRDTVGLTAENKDLKLRLEAMEQQANLRDAINEALREELQRLKLATGQVPSVAGNAFGRGLPLPIPQYFSHPQQLQNPGSQPQQLHMSQPSSNDQHPPNQDSMDLM